MLHTGPGSPISCLRDPIIIKWPREFDRHKAEVFHTGKEFLTGIILLIL